MSRAGTPIVYLVAWVAACFVSTVLALRFRSGLLSPARYLRFLATPWKVGTFVVAAAAFVVAAPLSGDPTWDTADSLLVGSLTFLTAPWAVGTIFRAIRGRTHPAHALVATCVSFFSACWSYDLYILATRGRYPPGWLANLPLSMGLYAAAGMFWSLEWRHGAGISFAFQRDDWPAAAEGPQFLRLLPIALLLMAFVAFVVGLFVVEEKGIRLLPWILGRRH